MNNKLYRKSIRIRDYFFSYSFVFSVCAVVVFSYFILTDRTFISNDGWRQHFVSFVYFGEYVRDIIKNLILNHKLEIPAYSFGIGMGGDILTTLNYYVIGDPLSLLSVVTPQKYARFAYDFLVLFRLYLAGFSFSLFSRYKGVNSRSALTAGSLVYVFTLYVFHFGITHPFFINPMIYLPLLLLGVEKIFDGKRPYLFIIMVFISAVSNFYFFYMLVILTILYVIFRMLFIYDKSTAGQAFASLAKIAVSSVTGVMLSGFILLPVAITFLSDNRNSAGWNFELFYDLGYYLNFPSALISSNDDMGNQTLLALSSISLLCIALLFIRWKKYKQEGICFAVLTVLLSLPLFAHIMNGFSYTANRWIWAYALLTAYIVSLTWQDLMSADKKTVFKIGAVMVVYAVVCVATSKENLLRVLVPLTAVLFVLLVLSIDFKKHGNEIKSAVAVAMVMLTVSFNGVFYFVENKEEFSSKFKYQTEVDHKFFSTQGKNIKKTDDGTFYRYSVDSVKTHYNADIIHETHGTSLYWSLQNNYIAQFMEEMEMPVRYLYMYKNIDARAGLSSLMGVKYYSSDFADRVPFGFEKTGDSIYKNKNTLPLGYTYSSEFSQEEYEKMSALEKQQAVMQSVMVENPNSFYNHAGLNFRDESIEYKMLAGRNTVIDGNIVEVKKSGGSVVLEFDGLENSETYVNISYVFEAENAENAPNAVALHFRPYAQGRKQPVYELKTSTPYDIRYSGRNDFLVNTGYCKNAKDTIEITFSTAGKYDISKLEILCLPMDNLENQVSALKQDVLENIVIGNDCVTGDIKLDEDKVLCLSVPYSTGWTAYVDGKETEILRANTMFSALELESGKHSVELKYKTPYLNYGIAVSCAGVLAMLGMIVFTEVKGKNSKGKRTREV